VLCCVYPRVSRGVYARVAIVTQLWTPTRAARVTKSFTSFKKLFGK